MKKIIGILTNMALFTAVVLTATSTAIADEETNDKASKLFIVYGDFSTDKSGVIVSSLEPVEFNNIPSLKGVIQNKKNWTHNKQVYIPIDKISIVYEFKSLQDYKEATKLYYEKKAEQ